MACITVFKVYLCYCKYPKYLFIMLIAHANYTNVFKELDDLPRHSFVKGYVSRLFLKV